MTTTTIQGARRLGPQPNRIRYSPSATSRKGVAIIAAWAGLPGKAAKYRRPGLTTHHVHAMRQTGGALDVVLAALEASPNPRALLTPMLAVVERRQSVTRTLPELFDADQREEYEATCAVARVLAGDHSALPEAIKEQGDEVAASQELYTYLMALHTGGGNA